MIDIGKYVSISKKRDLSDNSKEGANPEKSKEATSSSSYSNQYLFEEGSALQNVEAIFLIA